MDKRIWWSHKQNTWITFDELINELQGEKDMENELTGYCQVVGCMNHVPTTNESPYCGLHMGEGLRAVPLLTKYDYVLCVDAQSGCNVTGLINTLNDMRERLWNTARQHNKGTEWVNQHPIMQCYAYQLAHLAHGREPIEWDGYFKAYSFCKSVVADKTLPEFDYTLLSEADYYHLGQDVS